MVLRTCQLLNTRQRSWVDQVKSLGVCFVLLAAGTGVEWSGAERERGGVHAHLTPAYFRRCVNVMICGRVHHMCVVMG